MLDYMSLARAAAKLSPCRTQVGAVIAFGYQIYAVAYNAPPSPALGCDQASCIQAGHCINTLHAEIMCLMQLPPGVIGATLYITVPPCMACVNAIIAASPAIAEVVYDQDYWSSEYLKRLVDNGISVRKNYDCLISTFDR